MVPGKAFSEDGAEVSEPLESVDFCDRVRLKLSVGSDDGILKRLDVDKVDSVALLV